MSWPSGSLWRPTLLGWRKSWMTPTWPGWTLRARLKLWRRSWPTWRGTTRMWVKKKKNALGSGNSKSHILHVHLSLSAAPAGCHGAEESNLQVRRAGRCGRSQRSGPVPDHRGREGQLREDCREERRWPQTLAWEPGSTTLKVQSVYRYSLTGNLFFGTLTVFSLFSDRRRAGAGITEHRGPSRSPDGAGRLISTDTDVGNWACVAAKLGKQEFYVSPKIANGFPHKGWNVHMFSQIKAWNFL